MADATVGFLISYLTELLTTEANMLTSIHSDISRINRQLDSIKYYLKDADTRAEAQGNATASNDGVKLWVKQLMEVSFRIEDVVDEYIYHMAKQTHSHESCFIHFSYKFVGCIAMLKSRHRIASQIRDLQIEVCQIKDTSTIYGFHSRGESSTTTSDAAGSWYDPRKKALYLKDSEVVGIESPKAELIDVLLDDQQPQRTVIAVVGMGGLGKTTLAKKVYDSVKDKFDCRAWITVSQSYKKEELLKNVIKDFHQEKDDAMKGVRLTEESREYLRQIDGMNEDTLTKELREYLQQKRYFVIFDDVWKVEFWGDIEHALLDNKNGGRIVITTRNKDVANFCKTSQFVHVHELQSLPREKALQLFCIKAFRSEVCPADLLDLSTKIVYKCEGLPLATEAIAGLLSTKNKTIEEWRNVHDSLSTELESNHHLKSIIKILSLSYSDLPGLLKSCFLYFGIYPKDHPVRCSRIIRQWIAEGFVREKKDKTLEAVAQQLLTELIHRSLVQVSDVNYYNGKVTECRIHDLLREVIVGKMEDSSFCHVLSEKESMPAIFSTEGVATRRLSFINSSFNALRRNTNQNYQVRSILNFNDVGDIIFVDNSILKTLAKNIKLLKVLDLEDSPVKYVHEDIGDLFHLRYLSLRNTSVEKLPKSIRKLVNLETLDLRQSFVFEIPSEIKRLRKLRHLLGYHRDTNIAKFNPSRFEGIKVQAGIGCSESLQKLHMLDVSETGVEVIKELGELTQLRKLGIHKLKREDGKALCECIEKMKHLESLEVNATSRDDFIDLDYISSPPQYLCSLRLKGRLRKLPEWIAMLQNLASLWILWSKLENDPIKTLKKLHNLVVLRMGFRGYVGEQLHFEEGVFQKLKFLGLKHSSGLKSLIIEEGALPNLDMLFLGSTALMKEVPSDIRHLKKLKLLHFEDVPDELVHGIRRGGVLRHIVEHVPRIIVQNQLRSENL